MFKLVSKFKPRGDQPQAIAKLTKNLKDIRDWGFSKKEDIVSEFWQVHDKKLLEKEMKTAAKNLDFERAAEIRDLIKKI